MRFKLSGDHYNDEWQSLRPRLLTPSDDSAWKQAIADFFQTRLQTRYLTPLSRLIDADDGAGEGFSIVTIQCSLIEFLESLRSGQIYKFGGGRSDFYYHDSQAMFVKFLRTREPFRSCFSKRIAIDFYKGVRCGVFHEARTKYGWKIKKGEDTDPPIDADRKYVFRNPFQTALNTYISTYSDDLLRDKKLQMGFIRKYDDFATDSPEA